MALVRCNKATSANVDVEHDIFTGTSKTINVTGDYEHLYLIFSKTSTVTVTIDGVSQTVTSDSAGSYVDVSGNFHNPVIVYGDAAAAVDARWYTVVAY